LIGWLVDLLPEEIGANVTYWLTKRREQAEKRRRRKRK
jgi:hypothetical protein